MFAHIPAISQAHVTACEAVRKEKQPVLSCEHCPMVWYHKLCAEIESKFKCQPGYVI